MKCWPAYILRAFELTMWSKIIYFVPRQWEKAEHLFIKGYIELIDLMKMEELVETDNNWQKASR